MIHTRRYINKAKYAPKMTDSLKPLDVVELLKEEIDYNNIPFEIVSEATGIPVKRVERIYYNDLPKEDEIVSILEWIGKERKRMIEVENFDLYITMKSGRKHIFEVSGTELDWLLDKMFERESGSFQNFGTEEVINIFEIEYLKYEKVNYESTEF